MSPFKKAFLGLIAGVLLASGALGAGQLSPFALWGLQFKGADGSAAAPEYSYSGDATMGMYRAPSEVRFAIAGGDVVSVNANGVQLASTEALRISSGAIGSASDIVLIRDAANTLAQRNGANAQVHNLYNTFTSSSIYERLTEKWVSSVATITTEAAGGGTVRALVIGQVVTVANLPTCAAGAEGARAGVTDSLSPVSLATVVGGGAVHVPVYCNGTNWIVN